jgi:hypothetical protein
MTGKPVVLAGDECEAMAAGAAIAHCCLFSAPSLSASATFGHAPVPVAALISFDRRH